MVGMSLTFHWFLPTSGDGRAIIGRGHSIPAPGGPGLASTAPDGVTGQAAAARSVTRPPWARSPPGTPTST